MIRIPVGFLVVTYGQKLFWKIYIQLFSSQLCVKKIRHVLDNHYYLQKSLTESLIRRKKHINSLKENGRFRNNKPMWFRAKICSNNALDWLLLSVHRDVIDSSGQRHKRSLLLLKRIRHSAAQATFVDWYKFWFLHSSAYLSCFFYHHYWHLFISIDITFTNPSCSFDDNQCARRNDK